MHEEDNSWAPAFLCCFYLTLFLHIKTSFKSLYCKTALPPNIWPFCSWGPGLAPWKDKSVEKFLLITPRSSFNQQFQVFKKAGINCLIIKEGCLFSLSYFANRRKLILSKESHLFYSHILVYILNASILLFCWSWHSAATAFKTTLTHANRNVHTIWIKKLWCIYIQIHPWINFRHEVNWQKQLDYFSSLCPVLQFLHMYWATVKTH